MSNNLDKSLQEIIATKKKARVGKKKVSSLIKAAKNKLTKSKPVGANFDGTSKIIVSNLPKDVTEQQLREYFTRTVGSVKNCSISYDKSGKSSGNATVVFNAANGAEKAHKEYNGRLIDGKKPLTIEIVAAQANPLDSRISKPAATKTKAKPKAKKRSRAKKTADELDAEMEDYFK